MHLRKEFHNEGIETHVALDEADVLIVQTAILAANEHESVAVRRCGPFDSYYCTNS